MSEAAQQFQRALGVSETLARLLAARGWRELEATAAFLHPQLTQTHSPWLLTGMRPAVQRIRAAVAGGESIRILGDYDADGTLATVVLLHALRSLGASVSYRLPHRLREGYGLQIEAIEQTAADGVGLAITVDTGIREHPALQRAADLGLDVIVTDHHLPSPELPPAFAVINPHQPGCAYPDRNLCGTGVAFKLVQALLDEADAAAARAEAKATTTEIARWTPRLRSYLKLVALATIADSVPLLGENRVLARYGLEGLTHPVNPGLRALLRSALPGEPSQVSGRDVSFRIAPRLNAAGRMGRADRVVELFTAPEAEALAAAGALETLNQERQRECARIQAEIERRPEDTEAEVPVLAGEGWHRGVLGIVAARVQESIRKPVLVAALEPRADGGFQAHGSGRAPAGRHLLRMLETCPELFDRFGGHAQAVGFTLPAERLPELRERLAQASREQPAVAGDDIETGFVVRLAELTPRFARELKRLEPWGEGNPEPEFIARGVRLAQPARRLKERHALLTVEQDGVRLPALFWNLWQEGAYQQAPGRPAWDRLQTGAALELVFRLDYRDHPQYGERVQLILREFTALRQASAEV